MGNEISVVDYHDNCKDQCGTVSVSAKHGGKSRWTHSVECNHFQKCMKENDLTYNSKEKVLEHKDIHGKISAETNMWTRETNIGFHACLVGLPQKELVTFCKSSKNDCVKPLSINGKDVSFASLGAGVNGCLAQQDCKAVYNDPADKLFKLGTYSTPECCRNSSIEWCKP